MASYEVVALGARRLTLVCKRASASAGGHHDNGGKYYAHNRDARQARREIGAVFVAAVGNDTIGGKVGTGDRIVAEQALVEAQALGHALAVVIAGNAAVAKPRLGNICTTTEVAGRTAGKGWGAGARTRAIHSRAIGGNAGTWSRHTVLEGGVARARSGKGVVKTLRQFRGGVERLRGPDLGINAGASRRQAAAAKGRRTSHVDALPHHINLRERI